MSIYLPFCRRVSCNFYQHFRPTSRNFTFDKTSLDDSQLNVAMHTTDRYMHGHNPQLSSYYFLFGYSSLTPGKETFPKVSHHDCIAPTLHCIHRNKKNRTSRPNVCVDGSGIKVTGNRSSLYNKSEVWLAMSDKRKIPEQMEDLMSKPQNHHIEIRDELVSTRTAEHH